MSHWSRRSFIARGLLPVAMLPALPRTYLRGAQSRRASIVHSSAHPSDTPEHSGAVPSHDTAGGRLTTKVFINDIGPFDFMVDTGAERTIVAAELASQLHLPAGPRVLLEGIIRAMPTATAHIERLVLGTLTSINLDAPTLPRGMLQVDGILGLDVLNNRRVILNFATHTLSVTGSQGFFATLWTSFDEVSVPAEGRSRQLRANDCVVQGVHATAFVDTGSDYTVSNEALFLACRKKNPHLPVIGLVSLSGVTGGAVIGKIVRFDRFSLGELLFTDTAVVVTNMEIFRLWGMSDQPALLMGMNCLRAFKWVSIDYGRKEFDFKTTRAVSRPDWLPRQTIA